VPYVGQFDNLVREQDRGHAVGFTRTIVVFTDGLAVCPVPVPGGRSLLHRGMVSRLTGVGRPADKVSPQQIRDSAVAMGAAGSAGGFAQAWRGAQVIPFALVDRIVLVRPQQVSRLEIYEGVGGDSGPSEPVYLGDLSPDGVRELLGPLLGERLQIDV
jgi:uncharacterized iron-regulated membrane protein